MIHWSKACSKTGNPCRLGHVQTETEFELIFNPTVSAAFRSGGLIAICTNDSVPEPGAPPILRAATTLSSLSNPYTFIPMAICRRLLRHLMRLPFSLAAASAGNSSPARMAMIAITTSNSISVKPRVLRKRNVAFMGRQKLRRHADNTIEPCFAGFRRPFSLQHISVLGYGYSGHFSPGDIGKTGGLLHAMFLRGLRRLNGQTKIAIGKTFHGPNPELGNFNFQRVEENPDLTSGSQIASRLQRECSLRVSARRDGELIYAVILGQNVAVKSIASVYQSAVDEPVGNTKVDAAGTARIERPDGHVVRLDRLKVLQGDTQAVGSGRAGGKDEILKEFLLSKAGGIRRSAPLARVQTAVETHKRRFHAPIKISRRRGRCSAACENERLKTGWSITGGRAPVIEINGQTRGWSGTLSDHQHRRVAGYAVRHIAHDHGVGAGVSHLDVSQG